MKSTLSNFTILVLYKAGKEPKCSPGFQLSHDLAVDMCSIVSEATIPGIFKEIMQVLFVVFRITDPPTLKFSK